MALHQRFQACGLPLHVTAEPSGLRIGRLIRERLPQVDTPPDPAVMALLFAADRLDHVRREIEPALARGSHVLSDRYVLSSLVYQSLDSPLEWVAELNRNAPAPDVTLLLDIPPELAAERRAARGSSAEIYDALETQRRLAARYTELAAARPDLHVRIIDGALPADQVTLAIDRALAPLLPPLDPLPPEERPK